MQRVNLESAPEAVKKYLSDLPVEPDGVELVLHGEVLYKVVGPHQLTDAERDAILDEGLQLIRQAPQRNKGVPAKVIEREVREAVDEVRRRHRE
jgi:hypothetical protein